MELPFTICQKKRGEIIASVSQRLPFIWLARFEYLTSSLIWHKKYPKQIKATCGFNLLRRFQYLKLLVWLTEKFKYRQRIFEDKRKKCDRQFSQHTCFPRPIKMLVMNHVATLCAGVSRFKSSKLIERKLKKKATCLGTFLLSDRRRAEKIFWPALRFSGKSRRTRQVGQQH